MSQKISDQDLINNLIELNERLGRVPKKTDIQINKGSKYGNSAYVRAFGSLAKAHIAAGLKPNQFRGVDKNLSIMD